MYDVLIIFVKMKYFRHPCRTRPPPPPPPMLSRQIAGTIGPGTNCAFDLSFTAGKVLNKPLDNYIDALVNHVIGEMAIAEMTGAQSMLDAMKVYNPFDEIIRRAEEIIRRAEK